MVSAVNVQRHNAVTMDAQGFPSAKAVRGPTELDTIATAWQTRSSTLNLYLLSIHEGNRRVLKRITGICPLKSERKVAKWTRMWELRNSISVTVMYCSQMWTELLAHFVIHYIFSKYFVVLRINFLQSVRSEVFTAMTMKNVVFWDVALCRSCVNRRFLSIWIIRMRCIALK
jgi:hypothetical protein